MSDKRSSASTKGLGNIGKTSTSVVGPLHLDTIISSLQEVIFNVEDLVGEPLHVLSNLSTNVDSAFAGISTTFKSLGKAVKGAVGPVDEALGGVKLAVTSLIDSIVNLTSATARELSYAVDNFLKIIIQTFSKLVCTVNGLLKSIQNISKIVASTLQSILKTSIIVVLNSLKTIAISLKELSLFVPVILSTVVKTLDEQITDSDVSTPIDVYAIISELLKCSEGTIVDVEIISSALDGSSKNVDIVITAISTSPPCDGRWIIPFEELSSAITRSFEEIICTIESVTKVVPDWSQQINPTIMEVLFATQILIEIAISISNGNDEDLEMAFINIAVNIRCLLNALDSITTAANLQINKLACSNTLESIQLSVQSVIGNVNDVFIATSIALRISETSILSAFISTLDIAIYALPSELLTLIPAIDEICTN